jgi:guanylate kinase
MAGILFIISAPSGSGKSTLVTQLRTLVEGLDFSVSYTTRAPRGSEEDGREYHFTTRDEFEGMIRRGEFLEWAEVFGNYYGTAVAALEHAHRLGKDLLLDIDVQGAMQVMEKLPSAVSIFILPPSPRVLEMRLRNRSEAESVASAAAISEADLEKRLAEAEHELKQIRNYKYALVNDVLDQAVAEMRAIVLCERGVRDGVQAVASSCRTDAASPRLRAALDTFDVGS